MVEIELFQEAATRGLGRRLADLLRPGDVVGLEGELGAGKTFLAAATIHALGVPEDEPVTSPTFALIQDYAGRCPIVHVDLYRIGGTDSAMALGLEEQLGRDAIAFVEWGRRLLPGHLVTLWIELVPTGEQSRLARISSASARGIELVEVLARAYT